MYYREVMVFVAGGSALVAFLSLLSLTRSKFGKSTKLGRMQLAYMITLLSLLESYFGMLAKSSGANVFTELSVNPLYSFSDPIFFIPLSILFQTNQREIAILSPHYSCLKLYPILFALYVQEKAM